MRYLRPIFLVTFSLSLITLFYFSLSYFETREVPKTPIKAIAQTGPLKEGLKTDYLAELLDLSFDTPKCLDLEEVEERLLKSPMIKKASASYLNPETLYIDYTLRSPTFTLLDLENTALDDEGVLLPLSPHFTPKHLPELYLGLSEKEAFSSSYSAKKQAMTEKLIHLLPENLRRIDLSHVDESSLGKQEIVLLLQSNDHTHYLRLPTQKFEHQLARYLTLQSQIGNRSLIIDLRVPNLAYLTNLQE